MGLWRASIDMAPSTVQFVFLHLTPSPDVKQVRIDGSMVANPTSFVKLFRQNPTLSTIVLVIMRGVSNPNPNPDPNPDRDPDPDTEPDPEPPNPPS